MSRILLALLLVLPARAGERRSTIPRSLPTKPHDGADTTWVILDHPVGYPR